MGQKIKKLKKIRLHREGTDQLVYGIITIVIVAVILWNIFDNKIPFWFFSVIMGVVYCIVLNFYRCPIRYLNVEDTEKLVVAPADGKIVVIEEVDNAPYFNDKRLMISIFMSLWNVHANWFPVDGKVKFVKHVNGNYHKAWLPKASEENEHADVMITTPDGVDVLCRQIAGRGDTVRLPRGRSAPRAGSAPAGHRPAGRSAPAPFPLPRCPPASR